MKTFRLYLLLIFLLITAFSCSGKKSSSEPESTENTATAKKAQKHLIVYGSSDCHVCIEFKHKLDSANIEYEFRDLLLEDKNYEDEMLGKLNAVGYKGYIYYPVVDIEGRLMVRPGFNYLYKALF